jgi:hypothetical protein
VGFTGATGITGSTGMLGISGRTGNAGFGSESYGIFVYQDTGTAIANGAAIPFVVGAFPGSSLGITNSSGTLTVSNTGIYWISFGIGQDSSATTVTICSLYLNGSFLGDEYRLSTYSLMATTGFGVYTNATGLTSLSCVLSLSAGDQIAVINESGASRRFLPPVLFGKQSAYLSIVQLQ